ncbi:MAG: 1-phosphofructokinase [Lachnospiraceae bacterium]|nr:1-phosphofructokinase [Lachnospiraceae bacterium]
MIYTVTFNPALDYAVKLEKFHSGEVNRTKEEQILPGGKGINVSVVLTNMGVENVMLGFVAGFTGKEIVRLLEEQGCKNDFIEICGMSRINVKIKADNETEINGKGPDIDNEALKMLYNKLDTLKGGDMLVLAGSIPSSLPDDIYMKIMERLSSGNIKFIVDATKDLLVNVLKYKPFLIKPNKYELGEIFGVEIKTNAEVIKYAKKLADEGAENVLVSMAGEGAVLVTKNGNVYESKAPKGIVVNSVGAGDSMVAGFIAGYLENGDLEHAFKMGISAGSASAFSKNLARAEEIKRVYEALE